MEPSRRLRLCLIVPALAALAACASMDGPAAEYAEDSTTPPEQTVACLVRRMAVDPASSVNQGEGKTVLRVASGGELEVTPGPAGSHISYQGAGAPAPRALRRLVHACIVPP